MENVGIVLVNNGLVLQFEEQSIYAPTLDAAVPALIIAIDTLGKRLNKEYDYLGPRTGAGRPKQEPPKEAPDGAD